MEVMVNHAQSRHQTRAASFGPSFGAYFRNTWSIYLRSRRVAVDCGEYKDDACAI